MILAESSSLDGLIILAHLAFISAALPGACGLFLPRFRAAAIFLGTVSVLAGIALLSWMFSEHAVLSFYLAAGTPLLVGAAACLRASLYHAKPPPSAEDA